MMTRVMVRKLKAEGRSEHEIARNRLFRCA